MTAMLKSPRAEATPTVEQPVPVVSKPATTQPAAATPPEPSSRVFPGDRLALTVWLLGAAIMAYLLLKDLVASVLFGW